MTRIVFDIPADLESYVQELQGFLWNDRCMAQNADVPIPSPAEAVLWWLQKERDDRDAHERQAGRQAVIDDLNPENRIPF